MTGHVEPFVSIIIPVYNVQGPQLSACLGSLLDQSYTRHRFEVIVVDDGSADSIAELVASKMPGVRLERIEHSGVPVARDRGLAVARGELIALTDADCTTDRHWLSALVDSLRCTTHTAVGGKVLSQSRDTYVARFCDYFGSLRQPKAVAGSIRHLVGANSCFRRRELEAAGSFALGYRELATHGIRARGYTDLDLSLRLLERGHRLAYCSEAVVYHRHRETLWERLKQFYCYGQGAAVLRQLWQSDVGLLGRYDPGPRPRIRDITRLLLRALSRLPFEPFTPSLVNASWHQRAAYPVFDYCQRVAFCAGVWFMERSLDRLPFCPNAWRVGCAGCDVGTRAHPGPIARSPCARTDTSVPVTAQAGSGPSINSGGYMQAADNSLAAACLQSTTAGRRAGPRTRPPAAGAA